MRTIEIKLFKFDELSEDAKQTAINKWRNEGVEYFWTAENRETLEKFIEIFPIKVRDWSVGSRGEGVSFYFNTDDYIEELSGQRLATYIWNNYFHSIYKGKYYNHLKTGERIVHPRVISKVIKSGPNKDKWMNAYYSKISLSTDCVLTGYYMDNEILGPIYDFLEKPIKGHTFKDLLEDCFHAWIKAYNADIDWQNSDEYIGEHLDANNYEFEEDGTRN